jgi:hypothetical protein
MPNFSYNVLIHRQQFGYGGANGIRQATPTCLRDYFWRSIFLNILIKVLRIFFEFLNFFSYTIMSKKLCKRFPKIFISKIWNRIYKSFLCLKTTITMFNERFGELFIHWIFFNLIHMLQWYIGNLTILKNIYTFNTKLNHQF